MKVRIVYNLSECARVRELARTGEMPVQRQQFEIDLCALDAETRTAVVACLDHVPSSEIAQIDLTHIAAAVSEQAWQEIKYDTLSCDVQPDVDAIVSTVTAQRVAADAARVVVAQNCARSCAEAKLRDAEKAARAEAEREHCAEAKREKKLWIAARGSAHLQRAAAAGYDCQRLYVSERALVDAPGFVCDFDGDAVLQSRCCPSEAALDLEAQAESFILGNAAVRWLSWWRHDNARNWPGTNAEFVALVGPDADVDAGYEVIVIENYLGKYTLLKIV